MRVMLAVAAVSLVLAGTVRAEEPAKKEAAPKEASVAARLSASLTTWFKHVKEGLAESSVGSYRQKAHITAAAAVRGNGQDSVDPLAPVWKSAADGKKSKALRAQRGELTAAVDDVLAGKLDDGRAKLDAFEKAHPDSPMLADVKEIRGKLDEASAETVADNAKADKVKKDLPAPPK